MIRIDDQDKMLEVLNVFDKMFEPALSKDINDFESYSKKLTEQAVTYAVEEEGDIAGFISFYVDDKCQENAFITLLAVLPEFRGSKIAQKLLDQCIHESKERGKRGIMLEVMDHNRSAAYIYEKKKFKVVEKTDRNSVYMLLKL